MAKIQEAERPRLRIRWWILPVALLLCTAQAVLNLYAESYGEPRTFVSTQLSVFCFGVLVLLTLMVNPVLRLLRVAEPLSRAKVMALVASMFVSAGISTTGLVDQFIPLIAAPFNSYWNIDQRDWDTDVIPYLNQNLFITDTRVIAKFRTGFETREGLWGRIPWLVWAKSLGLWMIFVFSMYLMFYGLSVLLYRSWAQREKLVFPLVLLPESLV